MSLPLTVQDVFNDEVLFAYFVLKLEVRSFESRGPYIQYARNLFLARSRLQVYLTTTTSDTQTWLANIRNAISTLQSISKPEIWSPTGLSSHRSGRFPLFQRVSSGMVFENRASEAISGAVASYFGFQELNDHLPYGADSGRSERVQRSPTFWLFAAACYTGDLGLAHRALTDLQITIASLGCSGAPQSQGIQCGHWEEPERRMSHWKDAVAPCLSIAVRGGHAQIVRYLLECGIETNAVSQDSTSVLAAVESRQVGVLKILLDSSRDWQRTGRHYDYAIVNAARIRDNVLRWKILMLLTDNGAKKMSQRARTDIFYFASEWNDVTLAKWAMTHGAVNIFVPVDGAPNTPTPLSITVCKGHMDIFRLIMDNIDTFVPVNQRKRDRIYTRVYDQACRLSNLEAFLGLVKLQPTLTPKQAFLNAAMVDGASSLIEGLTGNVDLQSAPDYVPFASGDTMAEQALYLATRMLRLQNLKFLLQSGCALSGHTTVLLSPYAKKQLESNQTLCQRAADMLAEHGCTVHIIQRRETQRRGS